MINFHTILQHRVENQAALDLFKHAEFHLWQHVNGVNPNYILEVYLPTDEMMCDMLQNDFDILLRKTLPEYQELDVEVYLMESCEDQYEDERMYLEYLYEIGSSS